MPVVAIEEVKARLNITTSDQDEAIACAIVDAERGVADALGQRLDEEMSRPDLVREAVLALVAFRINGGPSPDLDVILAPILAQLPVTLGEAKEHLRITTRDDDARIMRAIRTAEEFVVDFTGQPLEAEGRVPGPVRLAVLRLLDEYVDNKPADIGGLLAPYRQWAC